MSVILVILNNGLVIAFIYWEKYKQNHIWGRAPLADYLRHLCIIHSSILRCHILTPHIIAKRGKISISLKAKSVKIILQTTTNVKSSLY